MRLKGIAITRKVAMNELYGRNSIFNDSIFELTFRYTVFCHDDLV